MIELGNLLKEEAGGLSEESLKFLREWMWEKKKLRKYQNKGLSAISGEVISELKEYTPNSEKEVFRYFGNLEDERKSRNNKLLSFNPDKEHAQMMWYDETSTGHLGAYLYRVKVSPDAILVDTSLFYKNYDDIIPEVIVINERANLK